MNRLLLPIAALTTLFATSAAQAAPGKTFGGFPAKKKFILVLVDREVTKTTGTNSKNVSKVPKGIPDYAIGDNVTFKIGLKGQLLVADQRIKFLEGTERVNYYGNDAPAEGQEGSAATVRKSPNGKNATAAKLTFYTYKVDGLEVTTYRVDYALKK